MCVIDRLLPFDGRPWILTEEVWARRGHSLGDILGSQGTLWARRGHSLGCFRAVGRRTSNSLSSKSGKKILYPVLATSL